MKQLTFLVKPASSLCGLRCRYCFYEDVAQCRETQSMGIMSHETAEHLLRAAAQAAESGDVIQITFQGGEPTLRGWTSSGILWPWRGSSSPPALP